MNLLLPLSWAYQLAVSGRNSAFDHGILPIKTVGVPVVSVGNLTTGGTGKTPLVEYLVRHCSKMGIRVGVVSRGYGRRSRGVVVVSEGRGPLVDVYAAGDEAMQVARKFSGVVVVVGERRVDAAIVGVDRGAQVLILDDAFQHRYIARNLDIVVADVGVDLFREPLLPAGGKREHVSGLKRADIVALSKDGGGRLPGWVKALPAVTGAACIRFKYGDPEWVRAAGNGGTPGEYKSPLAFSGIGDHKSFLQSLESKGIRPVHDIRFRDHHFYTSSDVRRILQMSVEKKADCIITTEKDFVRLDDILLHAFGQNVPFFYTTVSIEFTEGESVMINAMDRILREGELS